MDTSRLIINPSGVLEGCSNPFGDLLIPEGVTAIAAGAFYGCTGLTNVIIPGNVTKIGGSAFYGCTALASVTISEGMAEIGDSAFWHCTGLTSVAIPESVTRIGGEAFSGCKGLTSMTIPKGVAEIGYRTFSDCTQLANVTISEGVKAIGQFAFSGCRSLANITIPASVTEIGGWAFHDCAGLASVIISEGVAKISERAFAGCKGLTSVVIPESVSSISNKAFSGCTGLTSVTIPESVAEIGEGAFSGCVSLGELRLPGEKVALADDCIEEGTAILAPHIPITSIPAQWKQNAVLGFARLVRARADIPQETQTSYFKYIRSQRKRFYSLALEAPELMALMTSERMIPHADFDALLKDASERGSTEITALLLEYQRQTLSPKGPTADQAAGDAPDWENPPVKESMAEIKKKWVYRKNETGGISLVKYKGNEAHVILPARIGKSVVNELGEKLFMRNKAMLSVAIPAGITKISCDAFSGCADLKQWIISPKNRNFYSENGALIKKRGRTLLCWPSAQGLTSVVIPEGVTQIGEKVFSNCINLTSVTIPEGVTKIGSRAFYGCKGLTSVTIPEGVTHIGSRAFYGCTGLTSVRVPESVKSLDSSVFGDCPSLGILRLPSKNAATDQHHVETASRVPTGCAGLTGIVIPEGVTKIGNRAFKGCAGLTSIIIPAGVISIGCQAFSGCTGLEQIVFPSSVEEIASDAFEDCPKLLLYVPNGSTAMKYAEEKKLHFRVL